MFTGMNRPGAIALGAEDRASAIAAVRRMLRSIDASEDELIGGLAETALGLAESFIGLALIARTMTETIAAGGAWQPLGAVPVRAITGVGAIGADGGTTPLASAGYAIDIDALGQGWVRLTGGAATIVVTFEAGLADGWDALPPGIAQGATMLAAHLFEARGGDAMPPAAVAALWRPWRRMRLRDARRCA
ncbi:head-tail connector protein [Sphingomonas hengshuiensis]|nr:hypothetical protein [Sphingomonas hengshuiensis]